MCDLRDSIVSAAEACERHMALEFSCFLAGDYLSASDYALAAENQAGIAFELARSLRWDGAQP